MKYLIRRNCEYSIMVEAESEDEAIATAADKEPDAWDTAWSGNEAEPASPQT